MSRTIKAIVFKTIHLKASKDFFEHILKLQIKESSARHFVAYSKSMRLVFLESQNDFEVELYVNDSSNNDSKEIPIDLADASFKSCKDPNGISIIIT